MKIEPGQEMSKAEAVGKGLQAIGCLIMLSILALGLIAFVVLVIVSL